MFDHEALQQDANARTAAWWQPPTRSAGGYGNDPAAATMARPTTAPSRAWSVEPETFDGAAGTRRWSSVLRPAALVCAGAAAAVATTLVVVFGGTAASAPAPAASPPMVNAQAATAAPTPSPPAAPATQRARSTSASTATHQVHQPQASNHAASQSEPAPQSSYTTPGPSTPPDPQHGYQWQSRHDGTPSHDPDWQSIRSHFDKFEHHHGDHDSPRGHRDQRSDRDDS